MEEDGVIKDGTFGTVLRYYNRETNEYFAVKKVKKCGSTENEIESLSKFNHPNIIKLFNVIDEGDMKCLVMEIGENDLKHEIETKHNLDMIKIKSYMRNILSGLSYIHSNGYIHNDIKPANILLFNDGTAKIIDFGSCVPKDQMHLRDKHHTNIYCPIDYLFGYDKCTEKFDIWGAGCIFGQLLLGRNLFSGSSQLDIILSICEVLGTPSDDEWPEKSSIQHFQNFALPKNESKLHEVLPANLDSNCVDLLKKLLTFSEFHRLSADMALQHPFFR